jgi:hypothetical protein
MAINSIGTNNESSLHAELKMWYGQAGDQYEGFIDGYIIDIVRGDLLIEIQTSHFWSIKPKLTKLLHNHLIKIVYPIATCKWVSRYDLDGIILLGRRKSPKRGRIEQIFSELRYMPSMPTHPNFSIEILFIDQEDVWKDDGKGSWRKGYWSLTDRKLLHVQNRKTLSLEDDYIGLLPKYLPTPFSSKDLSAHADISPKLAQNMLYCFLKMDILSVVGTIGRYRLYSIV